MKVTAQATACGDEKTRKGSWKVDEGGGEREEIKYTEEGKARGTNQRERLPQGRYTRRDSGTQTDVQIG
jgi:hypothetical protein